MSETDKERGMPLKDFGVLYLIPIAVGLCTFLNNQREAISANLPTCEILVKGEDLSQLKTRGAVLIGAEKLEDLVEGCRDAGVTGVTKISAADSILKTYLSDWDPGRPLMSAAIAEKTGWHGSAMFDQQASR